MPGIIFSEEAGIAESIYGNCQAPIRMFVENYDEECERDSALKNLFKMGTTENFADFFSGMTAMNGFEPVGENGAYPEDHMEEGYGKMVRSVEWKDRFRISQTIIEDGKIMDLASQPRQFVTGYHRTRENFGAAIYGGAIKGQSSIKFRKRNFDITCADGKPVFHTEHVGKVDKKKQTNIFSDAFSYDALSRAESHMHLLMGDNEDMQGIAPDTIVIPDIADLKDAVFQVVASNMVPEKVNAFNYMAGRWNVQIWPYLNQFISSNSQPWILLDSKFNEAYAGAVWMDRVKLNMKSFVDNNTDANVWNGRARFTAGFNNWRFAALGGMSGGTQLAPGA